MSGYVKAYRDRFDHALFRNEKFCRGYAWDWMVSKARYEPTEYDVRGSTVRVNRGQFIASPDEMARAWNWSRSAVNRFLTRLKSEHMIEQSTGHKKTLITICNYEEYQGDERVPGHKAGQSAGHKPDTNRTPKKKGKKGRRELPPKSPAENPADILCAVASRDMAENFVAHRKEIKSPLTARAARAMVTKLTGHFSPDTVLNESISNGWKGVFPEKIKPKFSAIQGGQHDQPATNDERVRRIVTAAARGTSGQDWG